MNFDGIFNMPCSELFAWRIAAAILWSIGVQSLFFFVFLFVMNFNLWHPITWIQRSISVSLSHGTWLYLIPLGVITVAQGFICCRDFLVSKKYYGSRFSVLINLFSLHNFCICLVHIFIGGTITHIYLSFLGEKYDGSFTRRGSDKNICLIEECFFLLLNGICIGIYFFIKNYIDQLDSISLSFPVVQQLKFIQVKSQLKPILKEAMTLAISPTIYFFIFYIWKGGSMKKDFEDYFYYAVCEESVITLFGFTSISLLFYSWLSSCTFILTMNTLKLLFQVSLTERVVFPICSPIAFGNNDILTLHQALAKFDLPIIQHLGYLDLKELAQKDARRRQELFTLSQPGGHPYNWNAVLTQCFTLIKSYTDDLNKANYDVQVQPLPETREKITPENLAAMPSLFPAFPNSPGMRNFPASTSSPGMRNMSLIPPDISFYPSPNGPVFSPINRHVSQMEQTQTGVLQMFTTSMLKKWFSQALEAIHKTPGISYVFGELPDAKVRYHLAKGQPIIWAVQGLAHLAASSFNEDSYGVVQKDLPEILSVLLQLKLTLDKLQKPGSYKRSYKNEYYDLRMKCALRSAVKRSIYCICIEFGDYVKELPMTKESQQQLQNFLLFKES